MIRLCDKQYCVQRIGGAGGGADTGELAFYIYIATKTYSKMLPHIHRLASNDSTS